MFTSTSWLSAAERFCCPTVRLATMACSSFCTAPTDASMLSTDEIALCTAVTAAWADDAEPTPTTPEVTPSACRLSRRRWGQADLLVRQVERPDLQGLARERTVEQVVWPKLVVPAIWLMSDCSAANSCWLAASDVASLVAPFAEESASWSIVCRMRRRDPG